MSTGIYSPAQVAHITGASGASVRNYAKVYADYMSDSANPPKGTAKKFTQDDVKLIAFIAAQTTHAGTGPTHDEIKEHIDTGALDNFDVPLMIVPEPKQRGPKPGQTSATATTAAAMTQFSEALLIFKEIQDDRQQREDNLHKEIAQLNWRLGEAVALIDSLERENARLRGEGY